MSERTPLEERLVSAALIGTGKQPSIPLESDHPVDELLSRTQGLSPEQQLLLLAGGQRVYRLAGRRPIRVPPLPPSPQEEGIPASPRIEELLHAAFSPESLPLLSEFLDQLEAHHIQFPAGLLVRALNIQDAARRQQLQRVLGSRARWLASLRSEWSWLNGYQSPPSTPAEWTRIFEEGCLSDRVEALTAYRRSDATAARQLLESTIPLEKGDQKRKLLECLNTGLNLDDELFLESLQTDRSRKVRQLACLMLSRLPDSRLTRRNCERVASCFQLTRSNTGKPEFIIQLPGEAPESWRRDGLDDPPAAGISPRSATLRELVRRTPLGFWTVTFQQSPEELVRAVERHEDGSLIRSAWTQALSTVSLPCPERECWEQALWRAAIRQRRMGRIELPELVSQLQDLVQLISPSQQDSCLAESLRDFPEVTRLPMEDWLSRVTIPWTRELSDAWLQITRKIFQKQNDRTLEEWSSTLLPAALGLSPSRFQDALQPWSLSSSGSAPWIAGQLEVLLRHFGEVIRLRQEFSSEIERCQASASGENPSPAGGQD